MLAKTRKKTNIFNNIILMILVCKNILFKFRTSRGDSREETLIELATTGGQERMSFANIKIEVTTTTKIQRNRHMG